MTRRSSECLCCCKRGAVDGMMLRLAWMIAVGVMAVQVMDALQALVTPAGPSPQRQRLHLAARVARMHRFGAGVNAELREEREEGGAGRAAREDGRGADARLRGDAGATAPPPRHGAAVDSRSGQREGRRDPRRVVLRGTARPTGAAGSTSRSQRRGAEVAARVVRAGRYRGAGDGTSMDHAGADMAVGGWLARQGTLHRCCCVGDLVMAGVSR